MIILEKLPEQDFRMSFNNFVAEALNFLQRKTKRERILRRKLSILPIYKVIDPKTKSWNVSKELAIKKDLISLFRKYEGELPKLANYPNLAVHIEILLKKVNSGYTRVEDVIKSMLWEIIERQHGFTPNLKIIHDFFNEINNILIGGDINFQGIYQVSGIEITQDKFLFDENHFLQKMDQELFQKHLENSDQLRFVWHSSLNLTPFDVVLVLRGSVKPKEVNTFHQLLLTEAEKLHLVLSIFRRGNVGFNLIEKKVLAPYFFPGTYGNSKVDTFHGGQGYTINEENRETIGKIWIEVNEYWPEIEQFCNVAYKRLISSISQEDPKQRFVDLVIGLESLYSSDTDDIGYKLGVRGTVAVANSLAEREKFWKSLKKAYGIRSSIVHGSEIKTEIDNDVVNDIYDVLSRSILVFARRFRQVGEQLKREKPKEKPNRKTKIEVILADLDKAMVLTEKIKSDNWESGDSKK